MRDKIRKELFVSVQQKMIVGRNERSSLFLGFTQRNVSIGI